MGPVESHLQRFYDVEMAERARRDLPSERILRRGAFVEECIARGLADVLEVGCGAGRDGNGLGGRLSYVGVDLSSSATEMCAGMGLAATQGLATNLPFRDASFGAVWSMSTLMHLPGDGMERALSEIQRVVRLGGMLELGVWGATEDREWVDDKGRYLMLRTDESLQRLMSAVGTVEDFATWQWRDDGGHYQWARLTFGR